MITTSPHHTTPGWEQKGKQMSKIETSKQLMDGLYEQLTKNYENGWADIVIETMEQAEVAKIVSGCKTVTGAMKKLAAHMKPIASHRAEMKSIAEELVAGIKTLKRELKPYRSDKTVWVVKVTGLGAGRGRYLMQDGTLDPWRFHAHRYETKEQVTEAISKMLIPEGQMYEPCKFENSWFEEVAKAA